MTQMRPFLYAAALLPDGRILTKLNMRDPARALDSYRVVTAGDELYDEALSHAVSYAKLLADGNIEIKANVVADDLPARLDSSLRRKMQLAPETELYHRIRALAGELEVGKQIWFDLPKS